MPTKSDDVVNKAVLVEALQQDLGMTRQMAQAAVNKVLNTIVATVAGGKELRLVEFGTFRPQVRAAREGHNPSTGGTMHIAAKTVPAFKASSVFKNKVNGAA